MYTPVLRSISPHNSSSVASLERGLLKLFSLVKQPTTTMSLI
ncbi:protein of unknown function [Legionella fallonii LLAP-10]|uniref:Uncharacterized protein n=1 Tax=Legionella fallonii LLAP-10 TaxID=1212491 RepID=A0A098G7D1_9GAMM|nr:protein of unknown function [Legionella fallonii LLAP-10]